jgi:ABC-2 type transport system ATP-binding protein
MIVAENLTRRFGDRIAVENLSLEIAEGEVFGFLGPNGAGKTTTVRMLAGLLAPTSGRATVAGVDVVAQPQRVRTLVGILPEHPGLYEKLSAWHNLKFYADLYELPNPHAQIEKYLSLLGLWERRHDPVGTFSKGMKQKLAIARALLHEPKVLFLDEPTSGLDPEAAKTVRDFIAQLASEKRTIFLCTHNLYEAEQLCTRIGLIKQRLIKIGSPASLKRELYGRQIVIDLREPAVLPEDLQLSFVRSVQQDGRRLLVELDDPEQHNPALIRKLVELGAQIQFVREHSRTLEEVYLDLIAEERTMKRTWVVMRKEWREAFRGGKTIWIGTIAIPLILLGASLFQLFSVSDLRAVSPEELPQVVGVLLLIPLLYFMMFPLVIPHQIAIYAIMSEKEQKSLEPLLATPLRTSELFLAKMLASVLPALLITWAAFALFLAIIQALLPANVLEIAWQQFGSLWLMALGLFAPLAATFMTLASMAIATRVSDLRTAQLFSSFAMLPVLLSLFFLVFRQMLGRPALLGGLCVALLVLDVGLLWVNVKLFHREEILTRWR